MNNHRLFTLTFAVLLASSQARAQTIESDYQQWVQIYTEVNFDSLVPGLRTSLDLQSRRLNAPAQSPNTILIFRPAVGYQFSSWGSVWLGYTWAPDYFDAPEQRSRRNVQEHRIYQQFSTGHSFPRVGFSTRTRFEERARTDGPGSPENSAGLSTWAFRLRIQARAQIEIVGPWLFIAYNEAFFHLNATNYPTQPLFDQNRAFVGFGYQLGVMRVEAGYMNQFVRRFTDAWQLNHVLNVSLNMYFKTRRRSE